MNYDINEQEQHILLTINEKKITNLNAPNLKAEIVKLSQKNKSVVCDFKNLDYLDSSGLSSLLIANRIFTERNHLFALCNISDKINNLIQLTKLDNVFLILETVPEAVDYILMTELEKNI